MLINDISPWQQGQTDPPAHWQFQNLGGPLSLDVGTTFQLLIYNPKTNQTVLGTGTWTATNLALGQADYQWSAADSALPGAYKILAKYTRPNGNVGYTDEADWIVQPLFIQF